MFGTTTKSTTEPSPGFVKQQMIDKFLDIVHNVIDKTPTKPFHSHIDWKIRADWFIDYFCGKGTVLKPAHAECCTLNNIIGFFVFIGVYLQGDVASHALLLLLDTISVHKRNLMPSTAEIIRIVSFLADRNKLSYIPHESRLQETSEWWNQFVKICSQSSYSGLLVQDRSNLEKLLGKTEYEQLKTTQLYRFGDAPFRTFWLPELRSDCTSVGFPTSEVYKLFHSKYKLYKSMVEEHNIIVSIRLPAYSELRELRIRT